MQHGREDVVATKEGPPSELLLPARKRSAHNFRNVTLTTEGREGLESERRPQYCLLYGSQSFTNWDW